MSQFITNVVFLKTTFFTLAFRRLEIEELFIFVGYLVRAEIVAVRVILCVNIRFCVQHFVKGLCLWIDFTSSWDRKQWTWVAAAPWTLNLSKKSCKASATLVKASKHFPCGQSVTKPSTSKSCLFGFKFSKLVIIFFLKDVAMFRKQCLEFIIYMISKFKQLISINCWITCQFLTFCYVLFNVFINKQ